ncbi:pyocin activator PrtN family protein [Pseudomonas syringae group genomosp. 3]|uniref:Uncharacterized protein n=1 Tax=Pseudomonas syringae pv. primulae TaxID=251707 RepID=A0A3M4SBE5_9PSED|nr:pyocin activator PrtN family protein [Pseudomonas syringae group genomosp. 3]RMR12218.1 hypothetical protein ALP92_04517 [Pseudomonas syringae pv. primulae]
MISLGRVCFDYMNLSVEKFKRKRLDGKIDTAVVWLGADSQKAGLGIYLKDLADYIDQQRDKALQEQSQLKGRAA